MDPDNQRTDFELPAPLSAENDVPSVPAPDAASSQSAKAPAGAPGHADLSSPSQPTQALPQSPLAADDNDLIEKEWVQKAKQIVAATHQDPHAQNRELSRFKADYLKKRYNKVIKLDES